MDALPVTPLEPSPTRAKSIWRTYAARALVWLLIGAFFWLVFLQGMKLRHWAFDISDPIRFSFDLDRGTYWGLVASGPEGYLNQYDKMAQQVPEWQDFRWVPWLDYGPLRLLVMREWGEWQRKNHPPDPDRPLLEAWKRPYWFNQPVILFNITLEIFAAACAFLLTRLWVVRGVPNRKPSHFEGVWQGAVAALLIWFSADIIVSGHMWFQWDTWAIPFYLCTCLLASLDWWFSAGVVFAIGVSLKGQTLSISPIFVIWPLVMGKPGAALRLLCGAFFGTALIAAGWLVSFIPPENLKTAHLIQVFAPVSNYPASLYAIQRKIDWPAIFWIFGMLLTVGGLPWLLRWLVPVHEPHAEARLADRWHKRILYSPWMWMACALLAIFFAAYWPWLLHRNRQSWVDGFIASATLAVITLLIRPRNQPFVLAGVVAGGLLACISLFHGSTAWWDCSVHYGSVHWPWMETGPVNNIPAIFEYRFGWAHEVSQIAFTLPAVSGHFPSFITSQLWGWPAAPLDVTAKMLFNSIYVFALLLSGIAIGLQARRKDRRMLVALTTPWIMFFLFPVQIQERYLLYASGAAACCIGDSVGMALLGLLLTWCSALMHITCMMMFEIADIDGLGRLLAKRYPWLCSPDSGHTIKKYLDAMHPDMGWGVLVIGLVFLYMSFMPSKRRSTNRQPGRLLTLWRAARAHVPALKPTQLPHPETALAAPPPTPPELVLAPAAETAS